MKWYFLFVIMLLTGCSAVDQREDNLSLKTIIPDDINGWSHGGEIEKYDYESIFRYMNGAGEIYRMYDYRRMEVLRVVKAAQPEITIEMFDMGTPGDAFGVFSHMREGDEAGVGEGSEYRKGLLCFWQGIYFFCIRSERETEEAKNIIFELAQIITDSYQPANTKPAILSILPEEHLNKNDLRFFNLPSSLNYHYFVAEDNLLSLNKETDAVLAKYGETYCYLLCIKYPKAGDAKKAYDNFLSGYLPADARLDIYQFEENKWFTSELLRNYIVIVFDAPSESFAKVLRQKVLKNILLK